MQLNGWKRIGIVASVAWIIGAGMYTFNRVEDSVVAAASKRTLSCEEANNYRGSAECDNRSTEYLADHNSDARLAALSTAFIPVPLGWGFAYLVLFLVRWIKRGFSLDQKSRQ